VSFPKAHNSSAITVQTTTQPRRTRPRAHCPNHRALPLHIGITTTSPWLPHLGLLHHRPRRPEPVLSPPPATPTTQAASTLSAASQPSPSLPRALCRPYAGRKKNR
jgi:hypothetical protein